MARGVLSTLVRTFAFHVASLLFGLALIVLLALSGLTFGFVFVCVCAGSSRPVRVLVAFLWRSELRLNSLVKQDENKNAAPAPSADRRQTQAPQREAEASAAAVGQRREVTASVMFLSLGYFLLFRGLFNVIFSVLPLLLWFVAIGQVVRVDTEASLGFAIDITVDDGLGSRIFAGVAFAFFAHQIGVTAAACSVLVSDKVSAFLFSGTSQRETPSAMTSLLRGGLIASEVPMHEAYQYHAAMHSPNMFNFGNQPYESSKRPSLRHAPPPPLLHAPPPQPPPPPRPPILEESSSAAGRMEDRHMNGDRRPQIERYASEPNLHSFPPRPGFPPMHPAAFACGHSDLDDTYRAGVEAKEIELCCMKIVMKRSTEPPSDTGRRRSGGQQGSGRGRRFEFEPTRSNRGGRRFEFEPSRSDRDRRRPESEPPFEFHERKSFVQSDRQYKKEMKRILKKKLKRCNSFDSVYVTPVPAVDFDFKQGSSTYGPFDPSAPPMLPVTRRMDNREGSWNKDYPMARPADPFDDLMAPSSLLQLHKSKSDDEEYIQTYTLEEAEHAYAQQLQEERDRYRVTRQQNREIQLGSSMTAKDTRERPHEQRKGRQLRSASTTKLEEKKPPIKPKLSLQLNRRADDRRRVDSIGMQEGGSAVTAAKPAPRLNGRQAVSNDQEIRQNAAALFNDQMASLTSSSRAIKLAGQYQAGAPFEVTESDLHGYDGSVPQTPVDDDFMNMSKYSGLVYSRSPPNMVSSLDTGPVYRGQPDYAVFSPVGSFTSTGRDSFFENREYDVLSPTNSLLDEDFPSEKFQQVYRSIRLTGTTVTSSSRVSEFDDVPGRRDKVHFNAFAPPSVCPSPKPFYFSVWAFLLNQRAEMREMADAHDPEATRISADAKIDVRRGALVHVTLEAPSGFRILNGATQGFPWEGKPSNVTYAIECTEGADFGQVLFKAKVVVGSDVAELRSYLLVTSRKLEPADLEVQLIDSTLEVMEKTYKEIPYASLEMKELVGQGYFGDAYRASYNGEEVVVKTLRAGEFGETNEQILKEFQHEAAMLSMFGHHPCIVPFVGASTDLRYPLSLITKYLPFGNLEENLRQPNASTAFSTTMKTLMLKDAAAGVLNIHEGGFIHRDIAARNCLVDTDHRVKICDFGLCRRVNASYGGSLMKDAVGPVKYMAPESLHPPHAFSYQSDSYMFGVLMWETYTMSSPFSSMTPIEAMMRVMRGERLSVPSTISPDLQTLMESCFHDTPAKRPTMTEILTTLDSSASNIKRPALVTEAATSSLSTQQRQPVWGVV